MLAAPGHPWLLGGRAAAILMLPQADQAPDQQGWRWPWLTRTTV